MDATFRAAEAHGIRAILGKVMMDRGTYDPIIEPSTILDRSLRESADLIGRWHGVDDGRLAYAVTPRFAVSCSADMLRESAALARADRHLLADARVRGSASRSPRSRRLFPEALDYVDVYDRAGGLGERTILAHAIHLSDRELRRLVETGTRVAHCPASNLFIGAGVMPLARYLGAGLAVGLGSDVAGGPERRSSRSCGSAPTRRWPAVSLVGDDGPGRWGRSTGFGGHARRRAGARARRSDRFARGRQGGGPDRGRSDAGRPDQGRAGGRRPRAT